MDKKKCRRCGEEKDVAAFGFSASAKDKLTTYCRECYNRDYGRNREDLPKYRIRKRHGITMAHAERLKAGGCAGTGCYGGSGNLVVVGEGENAKALCRSCMALHYSALRASKSTGL